MRDHSNHITMSREQAVAELLRLSNFPVRTERVSIRDAFGRVLAQDTASLTQVPNTLTCCMDSIAVRWDAFAGLGEGEIPDTSAWVRGVDWEFANTGVAMPEGFDTAIVIEHVRVSEDEQQVTLDAAPSKRYAGTKAAGDSLNEGDLLAEAGTVISPDVAARIAGGNHSTVTVYARPKVAFIPTGDELVPAGGAHVASGCNIDTNSIMAEGKVRAWGGVFLPFDVVPDRPEAIGAAVVAACEMADIVVLNASSSKGSGDWACEELERIGTIICHETSHGPGHHSNFAMVNGTPIVGISGPAGGASFTLNFYLLPLVRQFLGLDPTPETSPAILDAPFDIKKDSGGKGSKGDTNDAPTILKGEERPSVVAPNADFFAVKFLRVEYGSDGALHATPLPGKAGSPSTQSGNAMFMLPAKGKMPTPEVGDIIQVEWR